MRRFFSACLGRPKKDGGGLSLTTVTRLAEGRGILVGVDFYYENSTSYAVKHDPRLRSLPDHPRSHLLRSATCQCAMPPAVFHRTSLDMRLRTLP